MFGIVFLQKIVAKVHKKLLRLSVLCQWSVARCRVLEIRFSMQLSPCEAGFLQKSDVAPWFYRCMDGLDGSSVMYRAPSLRLPFCVPLVRHQSQGSGKQIQWSPQNLRFETKTKFTNLQNTLLQTRTCGARFSVLHSLHPLLQPATVSLGCAAHRHTL